MQKIYKKYLIDLLLVWTISALLFMAGWFWIIRPCQSQIAELDQSIATEKGYLNWIASLEQQDTKGKLRAQAIRLNEMADHFICSKEESKQLVLRVSQIADMLNVGSFSGKERSSSNSMDREKLDRTDLALSFAGSFRQFIFFINSLERNSPVIFVDNFQIAAPRSHTGNLAQVRMNIATYVSPETTPTEL